MDVLDRGRGARHTPGDAPTPLMHALRLHTVPHLQRGCVIRDAIPLGSEVFHDVIANVQHRQRLITVSVPSMAEVGRPRKIGLQRGEVARLWGTHRIFGQTDCNCNAQRVGNDVRRRRRRRKQWRRQALAAMGNDERAVSS